MGSAGTRTHSHGPQAGQHTADMTGEATTNSVVYEVVLEEAKRPKTPRPGSASSISSIEDIMKKQKAAEDRRKQLESEQLSLLSERRKKAEEVRVKKMQQHQQA